MSRVPYVSVNVAAAGRRVGARELVEAFSSEVRAGRLPAGCRVPPVRVLERQLGLSKNTVQAAYEELVARGLLETRQREGVFVAAALPDAAPVRPVARPPAPRLREVPAMFRTAPPVRDRLRLSTVFIDSALLPREQLAECVRSALRQPGLDAFYDFQGYGPLREAIAARLRRRGMEVTAAEIVTTVGSQQALDIVTRTLEVRRVAVEDPVYPHARALFERNGVEPVGLRLDPFRGLDLALWDAELGAHRPGLLYAITSFQNPTGYSYSSHELARLLELSEAHGFALLEDDWGSDMLSDSEYRPSLRLLGGENVIYVNSFTKKILPSLRIGFLVARADLVPALVATKRLTTLGSPPLLEAALAEFLDRGYYDAHLARLQAELDLRYEACLEALRALMPDGVRWTTPGGGPTLWVDLPRHVDLGRLTAALAVRGIEIENTRPAFAATPHLNGFRVSYAYASASEVRRGIEAIAEELRHDRDRD